ncbi:sensor histidine kinase [Haloferula sargassicola]
MNAVQGMASIPLEEAADGRTARRWFWSLQLAGWFSVAALSSFPLIQLFSLPATGLILVLRTGSGLMVTLAMRWFYQRIGWRHWPLWQLGLMVLLLSLLLGGIDSVMTQRLAGSLIRKLPATQFHDFILKTGILLRASLLVIWSLLYFGIKLRLEIGQTRLLAAQSEAAARTSELKQLRAQVNPHFLFNALNSILAEKQDPDAVEAITQELAEFLRFSLRTTSDFQELGDELDALQHYLRVEKARFEEKLHYDIEADGGARQVRVPVAVVQPLVENAMKYGRQTSLTPLRIRIGARVDGEAKALRLDVANSGRWMEFDPQRSHGIGISNLRRRLELLYGGRADLRHREEAGWVHVEVAVPLDHGTPHPQGGDIL